MVNQIKDPVGVRSNSSMKIKNQENSNPNMSNPGLKPTNSPSIKSPKPQKSAVKTGINPSFVSPRRKIRERKFVVAKKTNNVKKMQDFENPNCNCNNKVNGKCLCVAYENLRASQEDFFKSKELEGAGICMLSIDELCENAKENKPTFKNFEDGKGVRESEIQGSNEEGDCVPEEGESPKGLGSSTIKRRRDILLEEARASVPESGSGRVLHLVKAFERLLTMPKESYNKHEKQEENAKQGLKWALPGLQRQPSGGTATEESSSDFCPGQLLLNAESLGLDANVSSSLDSSMGSASSRSSVGSRRSRRSGSISSGNVGGKKGKKKKPQQQQKVTSLRPFRLRTEQRGKMKEEEFIKKLQEMMIEEEKQRIPIAQGLPWTTDEPECLTKPPIKECTRPIDLKLHSDMRAIERAEFDHQVAEKLMLIEQYKMERERLQKLQEEEEIRRLRKELVPKAQPMPYFDRPFIPKRSEKQPTIPKEPKFHFPQQKKLKCSLSWNDLNDFIHAAS